MTLDSSNCGIIPRLETSACQAQEMLTIKEFYDSLDNQIKIMEWNQSKGVREYSFNEFAKK